MLDILNSRIVLQLTIYHRISSDCRDKPQDLTKSTWNLQNFRRKLWSLLLDVHNYYLLAERSVAKIVAE